eukprot:CAMPEP_0178992180 /NCGR_PEP_ID=MMETSP0795-20121207/5960_1 /TAXON_ID=88552 /ORGANISM="Amoebophrya sp., Strain Ameob2" /LENGTH=1181 /DNA_ID=CAMNT_0020684011 /DNA_START=596 /DNA_END=4141 /DNA_ORIENTATION=+
MQEKSTSSSSTAPDDGYQLAYRGAFGLKADVRSNVHFFEESQLAYPAGHTTVLYYQEQKQQKFFPGTDGTEEITCMAISTSKRYLAVAEKATKLQGDRPVVTIYDLQTLRKRKTCCYLDCDSPSIISMAFDTQGKFLLTQMGPSPSGKHDYTLIAWSWEKAKPIAATKVGATGAVHEVSFNPIDSTTCFCIGENLFKFFKIQESEGLMRAIPYQLNKLKGAQNYLCHAWLPDDRLVVGLENGELLLFDNQGEFLEIVSKGEPKTLQCIASFGKGFVTGGDTEGESIGLSNVTNGVLQVFEKIDEKSFHKAKESELEGGGIRSISISPSDESLVVSTSTAQLYKLSLVSSALFDSSKSLFEPVLTTFHSGAINGMDACLRKSVVITCGSDKTVRIWNYLERTCELVKLFTEEPLSLSVHPTGFQMIIGFSDKLRAMNILMDDLKTYKELPVKACREVQYSHGGQFFAAANGTVLQVYHTFTCELLCSFHGSLSRLKSIKWSADDNRIATGSVDGSVVEYCLQTQTKLHEYTTKGISYGSVALVTVPPQPVAGGAYPGKTHTLYAAGSDRMLKEIKGGALASYVDCGVTVGQLVSTAGGAADAASSTVLFASIAEPESRSAPLRIYKTPIGGSTSAHAVSQYAAHSGCATRLRLTYDENYLFSAAEDGVLFMFEVKKKGLKGKNQLMLAGMGDGAAGGGSVDEILVTRYFLDNKQKQVAVLEKQVEDLLNQIEFQLAHRDSFHKEKMAELEERYGQEIDQERAKYDALLQEKNEMDGEYEDHILQLEEVHQKNLQELESSFQQKMQVEANRFEKLTAQRVKEQLIWETTCRELTDTHHKRMETDAKSLELMLVDDSVTQQKILEEKVEDEKGHRERLAQLETDADGEIDNLKDFYEYRLAQEKDDKVRLRGQAGIHRKHHEDLKRQMLKKEAELKTHMEEAKKKQDRIVQLNRERDHNLKEIRERDKTIHDKEQKIYELKKQNQELEKFKFVLDYKIKELKAQIDPKNDDIAAMKRDIQGMDTDLEDYHRKNKLLQQNITGLQSKQRGLVDEIVQQRRKLGSSKAFSAAFLNELRECYFLNRTPNVGVAEFKQQFEKLVTKFTKLDPFELEAGGGEGSGASTSSASEKAEFTRQKEYLEKTIDGLKRALRKDSEKHRTTNMRILNEGVELVAEINTLRKELAA